MSNKYRKILYLDIETGGLDTSKSPLLQLSAIMEIDGKVVDTFNKYVKPYDISLVQKSALDVQNITLKDLEDTKYIAENVVYKEFTNFLNKYIDKYDRTDKCIVCGYNVNFDIQMLLSLFKRQKDNYLYSYIQFITLDVLFLFGYNQVIGNIGETVNNKLSTVCDYFNIPLKAHNSLEDIKATRTLYKELVKINRRD